MPIAITNLAATGSSSPGATSQATASLSCVSGRAYIVSAVGIKGSSTTPATPTVTGWSQTWNLIGSANFPNTGTTRRVLWAWYCIANTTTSGAITFGGLNTLDTLDWFVDEVTGHDPSFYVGGNVVAANNQGSTANTLAENLTMGALSNAANRLFSIASANVNSTTHRLELDADTNGDSDWTTLGTFGSGTTRARKTCTGWNNDVIADLTPGLMASSNATYGQLAFEIVALTASPQTMTADTATLTLSGVTPTLSTSGQILAVDTAILTLVGITPTLSTTGLVAPRATLSLTGITPYLWTGTLAGSIDSDLCNEPITLADGVALGFENWRICVQIAINNGDALGPSFVLGTSKLSRAQWFDITTSVQGAAFERGGTPGSRPIAGEMNLRLENDNGRWSPTVDTFHGPGTLIRIVVGNGVHTVPVFTGITQSWNERTDALGNVGWVDIRAWELSYLFGSVNDLALPGLVGGGEGIAARVERIITAARWPFGYRLIAHTPSSTYTLQSTNLAQDLLTELLLVIDSYDYVLVPAKNGAIDIRQRGALWLDPTYRDIGSTVPIVADSLTTENDELRLLSGVALSRAGGSAVEYANSGISGRYQKRTTQRLDLVTQNPGSDADLAHVASGLLGRGTETYRPLSVDLDCDHGLTVWQFLINADIGMLANVVDGGTTFGGYSIAQMSHTIGPLNTGGVRWTATTYFDIETGSGWSVP